MLVPDLDLNPRELQKGLSTVLAGVSKIIMTTAAVEATLKSGPTRCRSQAKHFAYISWLNLHDNQMEWGLLSSPLYG